MMDETKPQLLIEVGEGPKGLVLHSTNPFTDLFGDIKSAEFNQSEDGAMFVCIFKKGTQHEVSKNWRRRPKRSV